MGAFDAELEKLPTLRSLLWGEIPGTTPAERLAALARYDAELDAIARGQPGADPLFARLAQVVAQYGLPLTPFRDLLSAFRQDVVTTRYQGYPELLDYCARSANPVGQLMLLLYGAADAPNVEASNAICSALQLINFWQDVANDWRKARVYLPLEDLARFGVTEQQIDAQAVDERWRALLAFEVDRARALMERGAPLARRLPGRIGWEMRLVVQGGLRILERIERAGYDVFRRRPRLGPRDWIVIGWRALRM
jgi:squalene synthase HpnC